MDTGESSQVGFFAAPRKPPSDEGGGKTAGFDGGRDTPQ